METSNSLSSSLPSQAEDRESNLYSQPYPPAWLLELRRMTSFFDVHPNQWSGDSGTLESPLSSSSQNHVISEPTVKPLQSIEALNHILSLICKNLPDYLLNVEKYSQHLSSKLAVCSQDLLEMQDFMENSVPEETWGLIRGRISSMIHCQFLELTDGPSLESSGKARSFNEGHIDTQTEEIQFGETRATPQNNASDLFSFLDAKIDDLASRVNSLIENLPDHYRLMNQKISELEIKLRSSHASLPATTSLTGGGSSQSSLVYTKTNGPTSEPNNLFNLFTDLSSSVNDLLINNAQLEDSIPRAGENCELSGEEIDRTLNLLIGDRAHVIHPDLLSIASIFDEGPAGLDASLHLADQIFHSHLSSLKNSQDPSPSQISLNKPVIVIANTSGMKQPLDAKIDPQKFWGSHWLCLVILPKSFQGLLLDKKAQQGNHSDVDSLTVDRVYLYDSIASNRTFPTSLLDVLKNGKQKTVQTDGTSYCYKVPPLISADAVIVSNTDK